MAAAALRPALETARKEAGAALRLALGLGLAITLGGFGLLVLKMEVYRLVLPTGSMETMVGIACGYIFGAALLSGTDHLREMALLATGHRLARQLAGPAVEIAAARGGDAGPAAAQALSDVEDLRRGLSGPLCSAVLDAALAPVILVLLWTIHGAFAAFGLLCCVLAGLVSLAGERLARRALLDSNNAAALGAAQVADAMRCAEAVEAMGLQPALSRRWLSTLARGAGRLDAAQSGSRLIAATTVTLQSLANGGALLLGAMLVLQGEDLGIGLLIAMLLTGRAVDPFVKIGAALQDWNITLAAWRRLHASLAAPPAFRGANAFPCPEGRLVLERVTVLRPGTHRPLLHDVSLVVAPGDVVAIAGAAGSGKSTLFRVILGMQRPIAGGAFLDGHATWQWDSADLARHIGFLPQEPVLTEGTVAEAIARLGTPDMDAVMRAARLAGAHHTITGLPQGYATRVGPDVRLSMGQRQRIALARAIYGDPRLVLLDEPVAWLDAEGEAAVLRMVAALRERGTAVILTSHRPLLLRSADRVMVLRRGTLAVAGRPQRLLTRPEPRKVAA